MTKIFSLFGSRTEKLSHQSSVLVSLSRRRPTESGALVQEVQVLTEAIADTVLVDRVGVWLYEPDGSSMKNIDLYERPKRKHSTDRNIRALDFPQYFRALEEERAIAADDALNDPRTSEYMEDYLLPKGITSMLDAPIRSRGNVIGVMCIESIGKKRRWTIDEQHFASSAADIVAAMFENMERLKVREELQYRLQFEQLLLSVANRFINAPAQNTSDVIDHALQTIGEFVGVERSYTYRFDTSGTTMSNTNEWCAPGIDRRIKERQELPLSHFPWSIDCLKRGEVVFIRDLADLPHDAAIDKEYFVHFAVASLVWVPLIENGVTIGFVGFTSRKEKKDWSKDNVDLLRLVGETFVNIYVRQQTLKDREKALEERRELESRMQQAQKLESLGLLAGGVAHDFNNLLMGMLGNAGLLLLELPKDSNARERLEQIKQTAERAAELTSQLLSYSGKGQFKVGPVKIGAVVEEMLELIAPIIHPSAKINLELDGKLPTIEADATQIRQVVMNLITNASDSLAESGGEITVRTGSRYLERKELDKLVLGDDRSDGQYIFIEVSDSGCGMSEETLKRVFDPFFTTKNYGRGLGLAAVQGVIRGHRGAIDVRSNISQGTVFTAYFPQKSSPMTKVTESPMTMKDIAPMSGVILVVDDEEPSRAVVSEMLEQFGCHVISASSGEEGVEITRSHQKSISLILLDMTMPGLSGEETASALKRLAPEVPIVLMSGYSESDAVSRFGSNTPLNGFLQKPFGPAILREKIFDCVSSSLIKPNKTEVMVSHTSERKTTKSATVHPGLLAARKGWQRWSQ